MKQNTSNGMTYAPKGKPAPVVKPGEFIFSCAHLDHGHIYGMANALLEAGGTLKYVYDPDPNKVANFVKNTGALNIASCTKAYCNRVLTLRIEKELSVEGNDTEYFGIRNVETGCDVAIGGEDGRRTIELITAIFKSGAVGQTVALPLSKEDPFYTVEGIMQNVPHFYEKTTSAQELGGEITLGSNYRK